MPGRRAMQERSANGQTPPQEREQEQEGPAVAGVSPRGGGTREERGAASSPSARFGLGGRGRVRAAPDLIGVVPKFAWSGASLAPPLARVEPPHAVLVWAVDAPFVGPLNRIDSAVTARVPEGLAFHLLLQCGRNRIHEVGASERGDEGEREQSERPGPGWGARPLVDDMVSHLAHHDIKPNHRIRTRGGARDTTFIEFEDGLVERAGPPRRAFIARVRIAARACGGRGPVQCLVRDVDGEGCRWGKATRLVEGVGARACADGGRRRARACGRYGPTRYGISAGC